MQELYIVGRQPSWLRSTLLWHAGNDRNPTFGSYSTTSVSSALQNPKQPPMTEVYANNTAYSDSATALLYLHGHNDCFFQTELTDWALSLRMSFYAVDLPSYGRSRYETELPGAAIELDGFEKYFDVLDIVIDRIRNQEDHKHVILMGHSLGALIAVHYAHRIRSYSNGVDALILNSPFFEIRHRYPPHIRSIFGSTLQLIGRFFPSLTIPIQEKETNGSETGSSDSSLWYGRSLHIDHGGEWSFNPKIKAIHRGPLTFGWLRHILRAQHAVQSGKIDVPCPVLVLTSSAHGGGRSNNVSYTNSDCVLYIHHMRAYSYLLASKIPYEVRRYQCDFELRQAHSPITSKQEFGNVRLVSIKDALHDVLLSRRDVRQNAYEEMLSWINDIRPTIS
jgi:alpha-beta hydrolase superfamily lysophospholipase